MFDFLIRKQVIQGAQRFIDRLGRDTQAGLLARLFARLTGDTGHKLPPIGAEDYARLLGQREALHTQPVALRRAQH